MGRRSKACVILTTVVAATALGSTAATAGTKTGTVTLSKSTGLADGDRITVSFKGFPANANVVAVECSQRGATSPDPCNVVNLGISKANATGSGTIAFTVHTGIIGNGTCDATVHACSVYVSDNPQTTVGYAAIDFAADGSPSTAPTSAPASPAAQSASTSHHSSSSAGAIVAVIIGVVVLALVAFLLARRRSSSAR